NAGSGSTGGGARGGAGGGRGSSGGYVFIDEPQPREAVQGAGANVKLTIGHLKIDDKLEADDVDLTLTLDGGRLQISPLNLTFYGGRIAAWAELDAGAARPPVALKIDGDGIDYGRLLAVFAGQNSFAGTVNVDADWTGAGTSLHAIAASLNGPLEIRGQDGEIDNRWLKVITGGVSDILGPLFGNRDTAALHCVLLTSQARGGVLTIDGLALDSEVFTLYGGGLIDLRDESLDLSFNSGTRELAVSSLVPPFNVTGTLKDPKIRPDIAGTVTGLTRVLGGLANPEGALAIFTGGGSDSGSDGGSGGSCARAIEEANEPRPASSLSDLLSSDPVGTLSDTAEGAAETIVEGLEGVLRGADPSNLEDAAEEALEGLKGLFGR
ncbi:MAG: AsmA family protein, partial [Alphaproteobacteria bacterium]|nr:AsmA family protein [Alphaproteobacteria bacterium]